MFVSFDDFFSEKKDKDNMIPEVVLDYLNKDLPEGLKYVQVAEDSLVMMPEKETIQVGGFSIEPDSEMKKYLGKNPSISDALAFSYNYQKKFKIKPTNGDFLVLNGKEIPIDKFTVNLVSISKINDYEFTVTPSKFPSPISIEIGDEEYSIDMKLRRVPFPSTSEMRFESEDSKTLKIELHMDGIKKKSKFKLNYNLKNANTVLDMVKTISIFVSFTKGNGRISFDPSPNSIVIPGGLKTDDGSLEKSLVFWKKVLFIEKELNIRFDLPENDIDINTQLTVEQIYQGLAYKRATRNNNIIKSIDVGNENPLTDEVKNKLGELSSILFTTLGNVSVLGRDIEVPVLIGLFDIKLSGIENNKKNHTIKFSDYSSKKRGYLVCLYFKTEAEMTEYMESWSNEKNDKLMQACSPADYIDKM